MRDAAMVGLATLSGTVGKTTHLVIAGAEASSKLEKAGKLGISVLDDAEFLRNLELPAEP